MKEGEKITELEQTVEENDVGVVVTSDLKSHQQCVQAAKKAQSVLGMVKRHFKVIDIEDFNVLYKTYISLHLEYLYRRGLHTSRKTLNV